MELLPGVEIAGVSPALYIRKYRTLVIADTHIGYEDELASRGIFIPRFQLRKALDLLEKLLSDYLVSKLVVAGDLKHSFDKIGVSEKRELTRFFSYIIPKVEEVIVIRGNHDNYLPLLKKKFGFLFEEYVVLGEYLIIHGHKQIPEDVGTEWKYLILGHEHPSIVLRDSVGRLGKFSCFIVGEISNLSKTFIVLPATGAYQTGSKITLSKETYISPVLRENASIPDLKPVIVDEEVGVFELPPLKDLAEYLY
ncbi:MAG: metallophosphoesterase [Desulfurococcaceae archaeon TW002]